MTEKTTIKEAVAAAGRLGIKVTGLFTPRRSLPKTRMGALADELYDLRQQRLALNKVVEAMKTQEVRIQEHIIENVDADHEGGVIGTSYKAVVMRDTVYVAEDWDKFYAHLKRTGNFHYLNKMLNKGSLKDKMENSKTGVPGIGSMIVKKISLTKV